MKVIPETVVCNNFNNYLFIIDVLSQNNSKLGDYVDCIYTFELEIRDVT